MNNDKRLINGSLKTTLMNLYPDIFNETSIFALNLILASGRLTDINEASTYARNMATAHEGFDCQKDGSGNCLYDENGYMIFNEIPTISDINGILDEILDDNDREYWPKLTDISMDIHNNIIGRSVAREYYDSNSGMIDLEGVKQQLTILADNALRSNVLDKIRGDLVDFSPYAVEISQSDIIPDETLAIICTPGNYADCDSDGLKNEAFWGPSNEDRCIHICDLNKNNHLNDYSCLGEKTNICDENGVVAGLADNLRESCYERCENCFQCDDADHELKCFINGMVAETYSGLCEGGEYKCISQATFDPGAIDTWTPGCSYPGCIPPWITGFKDLLEEEFQKVGGPVWDDMMTATTISTLKHTYQIMNTIDNTYSVAQKQDGSFGIFSYNSGSWNQLAELVGFAGYGASSTLVSGSMFFFAGGENVAGTQSNKLYVADLHYNQNQQMVFYGMETTKSSSINSTIPVIPFVEIATLPSITNTSIVMVNNELYLIGNGTSNLEIYKLSSGNFTLVDNSQPKRFGYSIVSSAQNIFIAGGLKTLENCACGEKDHKDVISLDVNLGTWNTLASNIRTNMNHLVMTVNNNKLIMINPLSKNNDQMRRVIIDLTDNNVMMDYREPLKRQSYCISEEYNGQVFLDRKIQVFSVKFLFHNFQALICIACSAMFLL